MSTSPRNGEVLPAAPAELVLVFSERLSPVEDGIRLTGPDGPVSLPGQGRVDPKAPQRIVMPLPASLPDGVYTVDWRVVSADSHPIHGAFVFGVGAADLGKLPTTGAEAEGIDALGAVFWAFRLVGYTGYGLLAGGATLLAVCWPAGWAERRPRRVLTAAWLTAVTGTLGVGLLQGPYSAGRGLGAVVDPGLLAGTLDTDYGVSVTARLALLLLTGGLLYARWRRAGERAWGWAASAVLLVGAPLTWVGTGHANAEPGVLSTLSVVGHLAAMAGWLGGLVFLLLCLVRGAASTPPDEAGTALRRFSVLATWAVVVLVASGVHRAWEGVGSWKALAGTPYGTLLVLKIAATGVVLWLGSMSRSVVRRRYGGTTRASAGPGARRQLRWTLRAETGFAVFALAVASALVATPPGSRPEAGAGAQAVPAAHRSVDVPLEKGTVRAVLTPAGTGPNTLTLTVRDRAGRPWDVPEVRAALELPAPKTGPLQVTLGRKGPGNYRSEALILPRTGTWTLRVTVRSSEIDQETVTADIAVG
ncbi:FixH family protein [Streptomyces sp. NPDC058335]|uniref:copper resistance CopC/CopD family protein n=1 Tax=Streptomyces sp. NPDC058335 TaxID=3346451 RepID=UPI0036634684